MCVGEKKRAKPKVSKTKEPVKKKDVAVVVAPKKFWDPKVGVLKSMKGMKVGFGQRKVEPKKKKEEVMVVDQKEVKKEEEGVKKELSEKRTQEEEWKLDELRETQSEAARRAKMGRKDRGERILVRLEENKKTMLREHAKYMEKYKNRPLKDDEEEFGDYLTLEMDETQLTEQPELVWNADYKKSKTPIWVMDDEHDDMVVDWLRKMSMVKRTKWKKDWDELEKMEADGVKNYDEGRSRGVVPCQDTNRVVLKYPGLQSDYIHANYVGIPTNRKRFIYGQTPMPLTTHAFWAMVVQEKAEQIVCLDESVDQYFPSSKTSFGSGAEKIRLKMMKHYKRMVAMVEIDEYELGVKSAMGDGTISVYHITADQNLKPRDIVVAMLHIVWNNKRPVVVHDQLGVGLGGTLIAAALVHEKMYYLEECYDIKMIVKQLRCQRYGMIDSFLKYWCILQTLFDFFEKSCHYNSGRRLEICRKPLAVGRCKK